MRRQNIDVVIGNLVEALLALNTQRVKALLLDLPSEGQALVSMEEVVVPALADIGRAWENGRVSLSQVYMAGRICEKILGEILPADRFHRDTGPKLAVGVLADHHTLGKRMVKSALNSAGFKTLDYGHGQTASELVDQALRDGIDILMISCLMLASALRTKEVTAGLQRAGSSTMVVVGGAPFRLEPRLWKEVGAQAMGNNSTDAVGIVQKWREERT